MTRVRFERVGWAELPGTAAAADVAITIAGSDSTPASLLEVMASAVPVVAGRTWSIDEWIGPGEGGALVECRDEDAVAAALVELLVRSRSSAAATASATSASSASDSATPASSSSPSTSRCSGDDRSGLVLAGPPRSSTRYERNVERRAGV